MSFRRRSFAGRAGNIHWAGVFLVGLLAWTTPGRAAERQVVKAQLPSGARTKPIGRLAGTKQLEVVLALPLRNREALTNLLEQLYDPASSNYHRYLTPGQFVERFGPTEHDYQALSAFAKANGFTVGERHPNRTLLRMSGPAASLEKAFHVTLRLYQHPVKELQTLRGKHFHFDRQTIAERNTLLSSRGVQGELLEIIARFQLDTAAEFGLQLRQGPQGHGTVGYNTAKQEVFFAPAAGPDGPVQSLAPRDKVVQLHILLDRSVVDIFGNDGITWSCEFFKADPKNLGMELYAKGGTVQLLSLDLWKLKSRLDASTMRAVGPSVKPDKPRLSPLDDAVIAWHMADGNDSSGKNSRF